MGRLALALALGLAGADLADAKKEISKGNEESHHAAGKICVGLDNAEAADLLIKVLAGSQPHLRDIAFQYLEQFKNPYAIGAIEAACVGHREEMVRAWCADALGAYPGKAKLEPLLKALGENSLEIKRAAARALGRLGAKEAAAKLAPLRTHADPQLRAYARVAWMHCEKNVSEADQASMLADKDGGVRAAALSAIPSATRSKAAL